MQTLKNLIVFFPKFQVKFFGRHRKKNVLKISTQYQELRVTEKPDVYLLESGYRQTEGKITAGLLLYAC